MFLTQLPLPTNFQFIWMIVGLQHFGFIAQMDIINFTLEIKAENLAETMYS